MRRFGLTLAVVAVVQLVGTLSSANAQPVLLKSYFPVASAYPAGYSLLPIKSSSHPAMLFSGDFVSYARHAHFERGASQNVQGANEASVVTVIARFRAAHGARSFERQVPTDVFGPNSVHDEVIPSIGPQGATYSEGMATPCFPLTQSELLFTRGPIYVEIIVQPANRALALSLGAEVDSKIEHASAA